VAAVLLGIDDPSAGREICAALEEAGHQIDWVPALEITPTPARAESPDLVVVDGEAPGMELGLVVAAWAKRDPSPAMLVLGTTAQVRAAAERVRARFLPKPIVPEELVEIASASIARGHSYGSLGAATALRILNLPAGGLPEDEAAAIVTGARNVDLAHVRESLRPRMHDYASATALLDRLCARRALNASEARLATKLLDGTRTVRGAIDGAGQASESVPEALPAHTAARLLWGLISGGAVALHREPPAAHPTARLRAHLRARVARCSNADHYKVMEVGVEAAPPDLDRALAFLEFRYGPESTARHDLGDLATPAEKLWEQIVHARQVLGDTRLRATYDQGLYPGKSELDEMRSRRRTAVDEAERFFARGQHALAAGDVFRAVSDFAVAARRLPDQPDYEVFAAWARVLAAEARGGERTAAAARERDVAEKTLLGRRPHPRAELVVGFLCEAAGDAPAAVGHLREALAVDDKLVAARQALARLGG
jgi:DNA-binding response OmpR family regulator